MFDVLKAHTSKHDRYGACAPVSEESAHSDYGIGMEPVWERILKEFLPGCAYNMLDDTGFEQYSGFSNPDCFCEIWIPVERKRGTSNGGFCRI